MGHDSGYQQWSDADEAMVQHFIERENKIFRRVIDQWTPRLDEAEARQIIERWSKKHEADMRALIKAYKVDLLVRIKAGQLRP